MIKYVHSGFDMYKSNHESGLMHLDWYLALNFESLKKHNLS